MVINLVGLEISVPTLIWTLINFFLLMFLLNKFLFKPVIRFMDERKARIEEGMKLKADAQKAFEKSEEDVKNELNQTNGAALKMVQKARNDAESDRAQALKKAKLEVARELEASKDRVSKEQEVSDEELSSKMPEYVEILKNSLLK